MVNNIKNHTATFILFFLFLNFSLVACNGDGAKFGFGLDPDESLLDDDNDGVIAADDNCDAVANADQADTDGDGAGDACDDGTTGDDDDDDDTGDDTCTATVNILYYADSDLDGYGTSDSTVATKTFTDCDDATATSGYATSNTDCDDTLASVNPEATETFGDGVDQNCNGIDKYLVSLLANNGSYNTLSLYNSAGQKLVDQTDYNQDDTYESYIFYAYNSDGSVERRDTNGDGSTTYINSYVYTYDTLGRTVEIDIYTTSAGTYYLYQKHKYAYDTETLTYAREDHTTENYDTTGTLTSTSTIAACYEYETVEGVVTEKRFSANCSGSFYIKYLYDANGNETHKYNDTNHDAIYDTLDVKTYNSANSILTLSQYTDSPDFITPYQVMYYTYDEFGTITGSFYDKDDDGNLDGQADSNIITYTATYSE